jgi:hypothetical protein
LLVVAAAPLAGPREELALAAAGLDPLAFAAGLAALAFEAPAFVLAVSAFADFVLAPPALELVERLPPREPRPVFGFGSAIARED